MCNQSVLKVLVFGLTVAGFSLAVTSTFTNYWVKIPANNGHAGLWQNCTTKQNDPKDILCWDTDNKSKYLVSAKVFMNMGWIAYGFSLVVYVLSHLKYLKYTTCGTLLIMTVIYLVIALVLFAIHVIKLEVVVFSWSYMIGWCSVGIALVSAFFSFMIKKKSHEYESF
ncbi:claudin domain-containing protein 2 [Hydra vulgaris]|uniref:claudin domain-containing protein 2 n=1 Tax=Hydra vulgaris TaxID=6087 RepID=UPI001F5E5A73|nr:claudin domain-containing protein 2-like isoform X1 [Hydra vulgaris]